MWQIVQLLGILSGFIVPQAPILGRPRLHAAPGVVSQGPVHLLDIVFIRHLAPQVVGWCFLRGPGRVHWLVVPHVVLFQAAVPADPHNDLNLGVGYPVLRPQGRQGQVVRLAPIAFHQAIPVQGRRVLRPRAGPPPSGDGAG